MAITGDFLVATDKPPATHEPSLPLPICKGCGAALTPEPDRPRRRGAYCPNCLANRRKEVGASLSERSIAHAMEFEDQTGARPTHTSQATVRRRQSNQRQQWEQETWEEDHHGEDADPEWFRTEILPGLARVKLSEIAAATGMSVSSASKVRAGRRIPHPRHWGPLEELSSEAPSG